ncbi:signal recognition particle-docking protein FtsY [Thermogladius sp. 4427co]|uniref:signal recognition particle-docking protein FtsY n=1 Tax=Thermogladius sp. 4427co TaxID=3450718 RepID=UPI003F7AFF26
MFRRLRSVLSSFVDKITSVAFSKEKLLEEIEELKIQLVSNDVVYEVAEDLAGKLADAVENKLVRNRKELVEYMRNILLGYFREAGSIDLESLARNNKPFKIVFLGVNGVGKTTTIAKIAFYLRGKGFKPLMVAADTFRAGAQEQLKIHGDRIGIPVFTGRYGADPASLAFDSISYARNRGFDIVLIDTAGRMHTDVDLVEELRKIVRVVKPHLRVLVVDALTGNDSIQQAIFFNEKIGVDAVVVAKVDAYEQGGVPLSIAYAIRKPIIFIGIGQDYKDLKPFDPIEYLEKILPE